ncbi:MAG: molecular chaperone TorD family protein [Anaerolineales bacterium]|nr:molecular chaperone TorD family protein [Anaerolineales bacterium]
MIDFESNDSQQILTGEFLFLSLLSRLLLTHPDKRSRPWIQSVIDEDMFTEVPYAGDQEAVKMGLELLKEWGREGLNDEAYQQIRDDHMRLFIGIGKMLVPPWESVYFNENHLLFQEQTLRVRNWYRRFGLESEKIFKEPDDHIGLELSFVAYLTKLALQALVEQDKEKFEQLLKAQSIFLHEHLLAWGYDWCELMMDNAETDFYKGLALLIQGALTAMAEQFNIQSSVEMTL